MRRFLAISVTTTVMLAFGCGGKSYENRLNLTLEEMRYRKRLDDKLQPAPSKGKFTDLMIFVRPPKALEGPDTQFTLTVLEAGKFDLAESFHETGKQNFYALARVKRPKDPSKKKAAVVETPRGEFNADVLAMLASVYGVELDPAKLKEESKKNNKFKHLKFEANGKNIHAYLYGAKTGQYEVALIFEFPTTEQAAMDTKIDLCLESFAVGEKARRYFSGSVSEDESGEGAAAGAPPVF